MTVTQTRLAALSQRSRSRIGSGLSCAGDHFVPRCCRIRRLLPPRQKLACSSREQTTSRNVHSFCTGIDRIEEIVGQRDGGLHATSITSTTRGPASDRRQQRSRLGNVRVVDPSRARWRGRRVIACRMYAAPPDSARASRSDVRRRSVRADRGGGDECRSRAERVLRFSLRLRWMRPWRARRGRGVRWRGRRARCASASCRSRTTRPSSAWACAGPG